MIARLSRQKKSEQELMQVSVNDLPAIHHSLTRILNDVSGP